MTFLNLGKKKKRLDGINEDETEDEDVSYVAAKEVTNDEIVQIDSTQGPFNEIPATQEVDVTIVEQTQEDPVYIPETQIFTVPDSSEDKKNNASNSTTRTEIQTKET